MKQFNSSNENPIVSVVIPAYNAESTLERAMASVLSEVVIPLELIVVDDGSTDSTPQVIDAARDKDQRVRRITQVNGHVAAACNTGLHASRGKYIAFLEADDEWVPGKLRKQLELFNSHPEIGASFTNFYNHDEVTGTTETVSEQQKGVLKAMPRRRINEYATIIDTDLRPFLIQSNFILRSSIMMPRELLLSLGGQDTTLRGDDDWDLWFRMGGSVTFAFLEEPLAIRHKGPNSMSRPSPNWYTSIIRSRTKTFNWVCAREELGHMVKPLRLQIGQMHRSLILTYVKRWEWWKAYKTWITGLKYGFDMMSVVLLIAGILGPIPFAMRQTLVGLFKGSRRINSCR